MDGDIAFIVDGLVGVGIVHPDQHVSAAPVDDVLGFVPVEVVGGILSLFQEQQLLGVDLGVFFPHGLAAVADGDEGESDLIEIPLTVVRDVPAQTAVPDFVVFVTFGNPGLALVLLYHLPGNLSSELTIKRLILRKEILLLWHIYKF